MASFLFSYSKKYVLVSLTLGLLSLYDVFVSIFLIKYILDSIGNPEADFWRITFVILAICLINIIITYANSYYNNKYLPITQISFRKYLHEKLWLKILEMNFSEFDNPEYYNDYTFVINDAENRIFQFTIQSKNL